MDIREINVLVLAYLGDTIYEDYIRRFLIDKGINHVDKLQKDSIQYVSAKGQARYLKEMLNTNYFTEEEIDIIKRARNYKTNSHPKNCDIITYKLATGLEALIGYLSLSNRQDRIEQIMKHILGGM
ncbi:MAG: ribonuclease III [Bacilli bacterium]|nr:ribonuclease III [Bacilli bacterium]